MGRSSLDKRHFGLLQPPRLCGLVSKSGGSMKPIKITSENIQALDFAISQVNGNAKAHTITVSDILLFSVWADNQLKDLLGNKKDMPGAMARYRSGSALPNAYKYSRKVNQITIYRNSKGWWLTNALLVDARGDAGAMRVVLTEAQDAIAKAKFSKQYEVSK